MILLLWKIHSEELYNAPPR